MTAANRFSADLQSYGFLNDPEGRARRGRRIIALLRKFYREDLGSLCVLDVGCSAGLITKEISRHVGFAVGVDPDSQAVRYASSNLAEPGKLAFARCAGEELPFADEAIDVVICNHVYEHAKDPFQMMREIARVLRTDGVCFFAGGHTFQWTEPHYRLPLLPVLPRPLASWLLRLSGRGNEYAIRFLSPWRMRDLFQPFLRATPLTVEVLREPERYGLVDGPMRFTSVRFLARSCAPIVAAAAPTQLWLLTRG